MAAIITGLKVRASWYQLTSYDISSYPGSGYVSVRHGIPIPHFVQNPEYPPDREPFVGSDREREGIHQTSLCGPSCAACSAFCSSSYILFLSLPFLPGWLGGSTVHRSTITQWWKVSLLPHWYPGKAHLMHTLLNPGGGHLMSWCYLMPHMFSEQGCRIQASHVSLQPWLMSIVCRHWFHLRLSWAVTGGHTLQLRQCICVMHDHEMFAIRGCTSPQHESFIPICLLIVLSNVPCSTVASNGSVTQFSSFRSAILNVNSDLKIFQVCFPGATVMHYESSTHPCSTTHDFDACDVASR